MTNNDGQLLRFPPIFSGQRHFASLKNIKLLGRMKFDFSCISFIKTSSLENYPRTIAVMQVFKWVNRACAQARKDIPREFQSHIILLRISGLWPTAYASCWYHWLTIVMFLSVGVVFSLSLFVNIFVVNSIGESMHSLFLPLSGWATLFKAAVIYYHRDNIRKLFRIHVDLSRDVGRHVEIIARVADTTIRVQIVLVALYSSSWLMVGVQSVVSQPADAMLPSIVFWPYAFAQQRAVHWTVLIIQIVTSGAFIVWVTVADTFNTVLISTACGHVTQLKVRLHHLGTEIVNGENLDLRFYKDVVKCCKHYENCLRYDHFSVNRD